MEQFNPANIAGSFIQGRQSKLAEIADQHRMQLANQQEGRAQKQFQMGVDEAAMRKAQGLNTLATQVLPTVLEQIKANPQQAEQIYAQANQSMAQQAKQLGYSDEEIARSVNAPFPGVQALEQVLGRAQTIEQQMAQRQNAEKMKKDDSQFSQTMAETTRHNKATESAAMAKVSADDSNPFGGKSIQAQAYNILLTKDPSSPEYAAAYNIVTQPHLVQTESGLVPVSPQMPANIRPPATMALTCTGSPSGSVAPAPGAALPGTEKPATDAERVSSGFYDRMASSEKNMANALETQSADPGSYTGKIAASIPLVGNALTTPGNQLYRQAQEDWVRAKLRKESGAVIADNEMEREIKVYFPQPGDSKEVISQKAAQRKIAAESMKKNAGRAAGNATDNTNIDLNQFFK